MIWIWLLSKIIPLICQLKLCIQIHFARINIFSKKWISLHKKKIKKKKKRKIVLQGFLGVWFRKLTYYCAQYLSFECKISLIVFHLFFCCHALLTHPYMTAPWMSLVSSNCWLKKYFVISIKRNEHKKIHVFQFNRNREEGVKKKK